MATSVPFFVVVTVSVVGQVGGDGGSDAGSCGNGE